MKKKFVLGLIIGTMILLMGCGKDTVTVEVENNKAVVETDEQEIIKVERTGELTGTLKLEDCFALTGRGYVITGEVESGVICVGDEVIVIKEDGNEFKMKAVELQVFRDVIESAGVGEFVGVLVEVEEKIEITNQDKMEVYGKQESE